jgi:hypothetical protein
MRAHTKTHTLWCESGSNARQAAQAENGESAPSGGERSRKHGSDTDECDEIQGHGGPQSRDDDDTQFHTEL